MSRLRRLLRRGSLGPGEVDAALRRALLASLIQDWDAVETELTPVVRADTDAVDAYLALARLYRVRGEIGRAIRMHQNLLLRRDVQGPRRLEALRGLAGDFRRGGFLQRAIAAYRELIAERPDDREALRALVQLQADVRDYAGAIELARRLARSEGRNASEQEAGLWVDMAEAAHAEGRTQDARKAVKRALRRFPRGARAWTLLGSLEAELGRSNRALAAWQRVPDLEPRDAEAIYSRLESSYAALGRANEFETFLNERLTRHPEDASARLALAASLAARGASAEGAAAAREVLESNPENLRAHRTLARILLAAGREQEALKAFEALLDVLERRGLMAAPERIE